MIAKNSLQVTIVAFLLCFMPFAVSPTLAETRVALVIGNSAYQHHQPLKNPRNDADEVVRVLKAAEFRVLDGRDLEKSQFETLLKRFLRELNNADVSLLYYSGHAVQVDGNNFLIPTNARLKDDHDLELETINLDTVRRYMQLNSRLQLIFMDACRDNPFIGRRFTRAAVQRPSGETTRGLALVRAGAGSLIAYSIDPDSVALDGNGRLSPFTSAFVKHALSPGVEIRNLLTRIRKDVRKATNNRQTPWENSSLEGSFYFVPPRPAPIVEKLHKQKVSNQLNAVALSAAAPYQPEGGGVEVTFQTLPEVGHLTIEGRKIALGTSVDAKDWDKLTYHPDKDVADTVALIGYTAADNWGNKVPAIIALSVSNTPGQEPSSGSEPETTAKKQAAKLARLRARLLASLDGPAQVPIGVGPVPIGLNAKSTSAAADGQCRLVVDAGPDKGTLRAGERIIGTGEAIGLQELSTLTFEPIVETQGTTFRIQASLVDQSGTRGEPFGLDLNPQLDPCDTLAGQPFDLQGVANPGVRAAYIEVDDARAACLEAVTNFPEVPRFVFQLGRAEQAGGQANSALGLFETAAKMGHIRANTSLGLLYAFGGKGKVDQKRAVALFKIDAERGDPYAMHSLGKRMYRGIGTKQDKKTALTMLLQAAEIGHPFPMNELGTIFKVGEGVKKDAARSLRYYTDSASRGDIFGFNNLATLFFDGFGVKQDYKQAPHLFQKAFEGGHPYAGTNIGRMYFNGQGVEKSQETAAFWYELSAERGDAWAAANRGWIALHGNKKLRNRVQSARYYALAASLTQHVSFASEKVTSASEAKKHLAQISVAEKQSAILETLAEFLGKAKPKSSKYGKTARRQVKSALKTKGFEFAGKLDADLVSLTRVLWLKNNPRFDLF